VKSGYHVDEALIILDGHHASAYQNMVRVGHGKHSTAAQFNQERLEGDGARPFS